MCTSTWHTSTTKVIPKPTRVLVSAALALSKSPLRTKARSWAPVTRPKMRPTALKMPAKIFQHPSKLLSSHFYNLTRLVLYQASNFQKLLPNSSQQICSHLSVVSMNTRKPKSLSILNISATTKAAAEWSSVWSTRPRTSNLSGTSSRSSCPYSSRFSTTSSATSSARKWSKTAAVMS